MSVLYEKRDVKPVRHSFINNAVFVIPALIKKSKYVTGFSVAYFFVVFLSIYVRI